MTNFIMPTIRLGATAVALALFAQTAFAAPVLSPVAVSAIRETTATFTAKVSNDAWKTTAVWFETGETPALGTSIGMNNVFQEGFFLAYPYNLKQNTTYYVRAAAMEGGATVYSPTTSFTTIDPTRGAPNTTGVQVTGATIDTGSSQNVNTSAGSGANAGANVSNSPATVYIDRTPVVAAKQEIKKTAPVSTNNTNMAAVVGAGGVFPQTLVGWIALFIAILVLILVARLTYDSFEDRKKAREEAEKQAQAHMA